MLSILWTFLAVVNVILCVLLIAIILLQKSRSHGAAAGLAFGAGMGEQLFGAQAGNILTNATIILLTAFLVNTTILAVISGRLHGSRSVTDSLPNEQIPIAGPTPISQSPIAPQSEAPAPMPPAPSGIAGEPVTLDTSTPEPPDNPPVENPPAQE